MNDPQTPTKLIDQLRAWFHPKDRSIVMAPNTFIDAPEISTPGNPAINRRRIYPKNDGWYSLEDDGTETQFAELPLVVDAGDVTYTPADTGDWGGVDPGNVDDALDWIAANRVWHEIATTTLGAAAASVTFNNIPGTYSHLCLFANARTDRVATSDFIDWRANADAGNNYDYISNESNNAAVTGATSIAATVARAMRIGAANSTAGNYGGGLMYWTNYANTTIKKIALAQSMTSGSNLAATVYLSQAGGGWRNTNAITRIDLYPAVGPNFVAASTFTLYGIL